MGRKPKEENPSVRSERNGLRVERRPIATPLGFAGLHQDLSSSKRTERAIITGAWWIFAIVHARGSFEVWDAGRWTPMPEHFAMLVPPHALLRLRIRGQVRSPGLASTRPLPPSLDTLPRLRPISPGLDLPVTMDALAALIQDGRAADCDAGVDLKTRRARTLLYAEREHRSPVSTVASKLGLNADVLSRRFRKAYGLTARTYVQRARISDTVLAILSGAPILDALYEAGYQQPSRFYDQFKQVTRSRPGDYAKLGRKTGRSR